MRMSHYYHSMKMRIWSSVWLHLGHHHHRPGQHQPRGSQGIRTPKRDSTLREGDSTTGGGEGGGGVFRDLDTVPMGSLINFRFFVSYEIHSRV